VNANFYEAGTHVLKLFVYGGSMDAMRDAWTDERLDDLNGRVGDLGRRMDEGFNRVDAKIGALDSKFDIRIAALDSKFDTRIAALDSKFDALDGKTDSKIENLRVEMRTEFRALNRLILGFGGALITAVIADTIVGRL
jgi:hypothetical protein